MSKKAKEDSKQTGKGMWSEESEDEEDPSYSVIPSPDLYASAAAGVGSQIMSLFIFMVIRLSATGDTTSSATTATKSRKDTGEVGRFGREGRGEVGIIRKNE
jgi:hypothetical protein